MNHSIVRLLSAAILALGLGLAGPAGAQGTAEDFVREIQSRTHEYAFLH